MITIDITPKHRIRKCDDLNFTLDFLLTRQKDSKPDAKLQYKKGDTYWDATYYYPTLGMACGDLARILADDPAHADEVATLRDYADLLHRKCKELEVTVNEAISAVEATKGTRHA